eukprot:gene19668-25586_t
MCVERAKLETDITRGTLQSSGYTFRALGMVIGAILGAIVYNQASWGPAFYTLVELGSANYNNLHFQVQLLEINRQYGIPDIVFALGDTTIAAFVAAIQYMPTCIMYVVLCPDGSEGTTYALLTTISNLAGTVASDFGSWMTEIWNVSNSTLVYVNI